MKEESLRILGEHTLSGVIFLNCESSEYVNVHLQLETANNKLVWKVPQYLFFFYITQEKIS